MSLPDGTPLELSEGASGADAAAAIGPGLAKAALAIRVGGELRDLSATLPDGAKISILTDRDPEALELIRHDAAHVMAEAVQELYPGTKVTIGPAIQNGFYYDFDFPDDVKVTDADLEKIEAAMRAHIEADEAFERRDVSVAEARRDLQGPGRGLQGRADRRPRRERRRRGRLALPQRPLRGPLPRPSRPLDRPDQGDQAQLARRRLLARRREAPDADPDLRHRLLLQEGPRQAPGADRAGEEARPPPPRPPARHLHAARGGAGDAVLAAQRHHPAAPDRGPRSRPSCASAATRRSPPRRFSTRSSGTAPGTGTTTATTCTSCSPTRSGWRCGR